LRYKDSGSTTCRRTFRRHPAMHAPVRRQIAVAWPGIGWRCKIAGGVAPRPTEKRRFQKISRPRNAVFDDRLGPSGKLLPVMFSKDAAASACAHGGCMLGVVEELQDAAGERRGVPWRGE
jgi:hypothetical protein